MSSRWIISAYNDYEIDDNTIIFKEKGSVVYKVPIEKGYGLIDIKENFGGGRLFLLSKYKLRPPKYIPKGYGNLTIGANGLYKVEGEISRYLVKNKNGENVYITTNKRELYYMDTSIITKDDLMKVCNNFHKISEEDIPKSFWFSNQYKDFHNIFRHAERGTEEGHYESCYLRDIPDYIKKFDSNCRLINEYELYALNAYNGNGKRSEILLNEDLYYKYCSFDYNSKVFIGTGTIALDNWWKVVSSMENPSIYIQVYDQKDSFTDGFTTFRRNCEYQSETDEQAINRFVIPVIDEDMVKKMVLSNSNH